VSAAPARGRGGDFAAAARRAAAAGLVIALAGLGSTAGAAPKESPPAPPPPDLGFYAVRVAPLLRERCASCHASGAGGLRILPAAPAPDATAVAAEFKGLKRLLDGEAPWRSRLVRKALAEEEGGLPHGGGALLSVEDDAYDDLLDFASGATLSNFPPEPEPGKDRRVKPGEAVELDGSLSYDRDGDEIRFLWDLRTRPVGSRASISGDRERRARLTPDAGGTYVARLRVYDGKVWSAAKPVVLEALDRVGPVEPDAVAASGLEKVDPAALVLVRAVYGDVLGRPPTPPEAIAAAGRGAAELGGVLLATLEAGRAWAEDACVRLGLVGDFEPEGEAATSLPAGAASGSVSPAAAEAALLLDPAFLRAHASGASLAAALEEHVLGRALTVEERAATLSAAAGTASKAFGREGLASPEAVVRAAAGTEEARVLALRRYASRFLPEDAAGAFPAARAGESTLAIASSILASPAYGASFGPAAATRRRRGDGATFVRAAFADLLGRRPTPVETAAVVRALRVVPGAAARGAVVTVLLDSGEVALPLLVSIPDRAAWVEDRFLRTLGRRPSGAEATAYRAALEDPDGGPQLVVRALLSSAEYGTR
jgi:hypothetical protein